MGSAKPIVRPFRWIKTAWPIQTYVRLFQSKGNEPLGLAMADCDHPRPGPPCRRNASPSATIGWCGPYQTPPSLATAAGLRSQYRDGAGRVGSNSHSSSAGGGTRGTSIMRPPAPRPGPAAAMRWDRGRSRRGRDPARPAAPPAALPPRLACPASRPPSPPLSSLLHEQRLARARRGSGGGGGTALPPPARRRGRKPHLQARR